MMGLAVGAALTAQPVAAATFLTPVPTGAQTERFLRGTPTLLQETATGAVEVTPLPFDHGHIAFGIAVYNQGAVAANFGVENVDAAINGRMLAVLPEAELARRAKSRALWTQVGIAVLTGAVAGAAAGVSATSHSRGAVRGPGGTYRWTARYRDPGAGALGAGVATAGGVAGIATVHDRLDHTLDELAADVVQTTTVDPQASYGGRLVLEKPDGARLPYDVVLAVRWNGADYPFTFRVTENGRDQAPASPAVAAAAAPPVLPSAGLAPDPAPVRPAVLVRPAPADRPPPTPVAAPAVPPVVAETAIPLASRTSGAGYRNGRDDAIIVPMR